MNPKNGKYFNFPEDNEEERQWVYDPRELQVIWLGKSKTIMSKGIVCKSYHAG